MKHMRKITAMRPQIAQLELGAVLTALSQIMQVVGTMLIEKQEYDLDPYDY